MSLAGSHEWINGYNSDSLQRRHSAILINWLINSSYLIKFPTEILIALSWCYDNQLKVSVVVPVIKRSAKDTIKAPGQEEQ